MPLSITAHVSSRHEMANRRRAASALMASVDRATVGDASRFRLTEYTIARGSGVTPRTSSATAWTSVSQSASVAAATPSRVVKAGGRRRPLRTIVRAPTTRIIHRRSERTRKPSLHRLGPRPHRRVLGVLDRLREPALRGLVGDVVERPVFQETMPPLGHRQHDADQVLEVEGRGHRGEVVHDAGQWLRRVAERQPRRRLALDGQALAYLAAHLARRNLAKRREEQLDRRERVGGRAATRPHGRSRLAAGGVLWLLRVLEPDVGQHRRVLREPPGPPRAEQELLHQVPVEPLRRAGAPALRGHGRRLRSVAARPSGAGVNRHRPTLSAADRSL